MLDSVNKKRIEDVLSEQPNKVVLSNPIDKNAEYKKAVIQKISMKNGTMYQIERFTQKQAFHTNVAPEQLVATVMECFPYLYTQMNVFCEEAQYDYKWTKKGKLLSNRHVISSDEKKEPKRITIEGTPLPSHNRKKRYILEEGVVVPPLVDLGVFTKEGKVVRTMYDKYKQINRFLEMVEDVLKDQGKKCLHIIDFGCGKSYLTFILYYYLVHMKGYEVHMTGLDLKADVIAKCNETAKKYGYDGLHFEVGDVNGYKTDEPVDMVVTLHACDTATDFALYNAISWDARVILSVPCCQHELNATIKSEEFSILTKYGIVKERMAALMTDAIRANVLEYSGYKTQLLEFIDISHSPKNILIRAVKTNVSKVKKDEARREVERILETFSAEQTLAKLIFENE